MPQQRQILSQFVCKEEDAVLCILFVFFYKKKFKKKKKTKTKIIGGGGFFIDIYSEKKKTLDFSSIHKKYLHINIAISLGELKEIGITFSFSADMCELGPVFHFRLDQ